jgi:hypothetical protein
MREMVTFLAGAAVLNSNQCNGDNSKFLSETRHSAPG